MTETHGSSEVRKDGGERRRERGEERREKGYGLTVLEPTDEKWVVGVYGGGNRGDLEMEAVDVGVGGEEGGEVVGFGGGDGCGGGDEGYGAVEGGEGGGETE